MMISDPPDTDATLEEVVEETETNGSSLEVQESSEEPIEIDEDDYEDEVEVIYVGAPTRFFDPASMDDPEHNAPRLAVFHDVKDGQKSAINSISSEKRQP